MDRIRPDDFVRRIRSALSPSATRAARRRNAKESLDAWAPKIWVWTFGGSLSRMMSILLLGAVDLDAMVENHSIGYELFFAGLWRG